MILLNGRGEENDRRKKIYKITIKAHGRELSNEDGGTSII